MIIVGNTPFQAKLLEFNWQYKHAVGLLKIINCAISYGKTAMSYELAALRMMQYLIKLCIAGNITFRALAALMC